MSIKTIIPPEMNRVIYDGDVVEEEEGIKAEDKTKKEAVGRRGWTGRTA